MTKIRLMGDKNQCPSCALPFNSSHAFDKHRTGAYGSSSSANAQRRCLTPPEMEAKGMSMNSQGWWITARMSTEAAGRRKTADFSAG